MAAVILAKDTFIGGQLVPAGTTVDSSLVPASPSASAAQLATGNLGTSVEVGEVPALVVSALGTLGVGQTLPNASLLRARAGFGRVAAGLGNMTIACLGDSNTRGTGSTATASQGYSGWPVKLAARLKARLGVQVVCDNFAGTGGYSGQYNIYDDRFTLSRAGIAPVAGSGLKTVGGMFLDLNTAGDVFTFQGKSLSNTVDLYYYNGGTSQSFTYSIDGGAASAPVVGTAPSGALVKLTINLGSTAAHSLTITWVAGSNKIAKMDFYDNTSNRIHVWNWGWHGSTVQNWTTDQNAGSSWTAQVAIPGFYKPDLVIGPALGTNDAAQVTADVFTTNMTNLINSILPSSSMVMLTEGPMGTGTDVTPFVAAQRSIANSLSIPIADEYNWMGGNEPAAEALGLYNTDHLHKTGAGHYTTARFVDQILASIA